MVAFIGEFVRLRKQGRRHVGLCPFHAEKTPSFSVDAERGFYYCFGCQQGGDAIRFVQQMQGLDFVEALEVLAERTGVALRHEVGPGGAAAKAPARGLRTRLLEVNALARAYFESVLASAQGARARAYLERRGLGPDIVARFHLGAAPDAWDELSHYLARNGARAEDVEQLGLAVPRSGGQGHYDRFRDRLMFPIHDLGGRVVGFSGRALGDAVDTPKYMNSPESVVYRKGEQLFGLYEARQAIRQKGGVVLVEGNVDVLTLAQAGLAHVVAPLGTALTREQALTLKRFEDEGPVVLAYDGDAAGQAAAVKAALLLLELSMQGRVAVLPAGEDPDSLTRSRGADGAARCLAEAQPLAEFLLTRELAGNDGSAAGRAHVVARAGEILARVGDLVERDLLVGWLAQRLGLDERQLRDYLKTPHALSELRPLRAGRPDDVTPSGTTARKDWQLAALLVAYPQFMGEFVEAGGLDDLESERVRGVLLQIEHYIDVQAGTLDVPQWIATETDSRLKDWLVRVTQQPVVPTEEAGKAFRELLADVQRRKTLRQEQQMGDALRQAKLAPGEALPESLIDVIRLKQDTVRKRKGSAG